MTATDSFDEEIDAFALKIEKQIIEGRQTLDSLPDFNPVHRKIEEADISEMLNA
ncbi:MAG: hypothetical protein ABEI86_06875 [Halobacteriaceae archaeon]